MSYYFVSLALILGVAGCAVLQNPSVVQIASSRLSCQISPEMVDGNLETVGEFEIYASIMKTYVEGGRSRSSGQFLMRAEATRKTKTLIQLDSPTFVTYIDVYAASKIPKLALDTTTEAPKAHADVDWRASFTPIKDKRHADVKDTQVVRFRIMREVLYLRMTADSMRDQKEAGFASGNNNKNLDVEIVEIPLKGAAIREVKFYGQE